MGDDKVPVKPKVGEGVTFQERVIQRIVDPNSNGRLDVVEIMAAAKYFGERLVTASKVSAGDGVSPNSRETWDRNTTPAAIKQQLLKLKAEADKDYLHGMEMPSDAQINELSAYARDVGRRMYAYAERGNTMDKLQGYMGAVSIEVQKHAFVAMTAADTFIDDVRSQQVPMKPTQPAQRGRD